MLNLKKIIKRTHALHVMSYLRILSILLRSSEIISVEFGNIEMTE